MQSSGSHLQVLIPVSYILSAFISPLLYKWARKCYNVLIPLITGAIFIASGVLFYKVLSSPVGFLEYFPGFSWSGERFLATGQPIGIVLRTDIFGALLVLLITGVGFLVSIYSFRYIAHEASEERIGYYYTLLFLMLAGMSGVPLTGDCFNFYVFLEVASISSYALVAFPGKEQSLEAAFKYMLVGAIGSILIVFAIGLLFSATGTLNMAYASQQVAKIVTSSPDSPLYNYRHLIFASVGLFVIGFSIKSAFFPAHAWLADAHPVAPSSISAMLSGLMIKATGVFLLIRFLFTVFGFHKGYYGQMLTPVFLVVAVATVIGGSLFAIAQTNLKRMLAYSTIAQMGYILIGISLLTKAGLEGSILHIVNHTITKSLLFLSAGAIIYKTGVKDIKGMARMGYRMPLTMSCFAIGAFSMVGLPPLSGFMSKWALAEASLEANFPLLVVVLLASSLLNAVYYFRVVGLAFFSPAQQGTGTNNSAQAHNSASESGSELPLTMAIPIIVLAAGVILVGLQLNPIMKVIKPAVAVLFR